MGHSLLTACCSYKCLPGQKVPKDDGPEDVFGSNPVGPALCLVMLDLLLLRMSFRGAVPSFQCTEWLVRCMDLRTPETCTPLLQHSLPCELGETTQRLSFPFFKMRATK